MTYLNNPKILTYWCGYVSWNPTSCRYIQTCRIPPVCNEISILVTYSTYNNCYTMTNGSTLNLEIILGILPMYLPVYCGEAEYARNLLDFFCLQCIWNWNQRAHCTHPLLRALHFASPLPSLSYGMKKNVHHLHDWEELTSLCIFVWLRSNSTMDLLDF